MATYTPQPTVTINGVDFTAETVDTFTVRRGRNEFYQAMPASVASVNLIDFTGAGINLEVTQTITIALNDSAGQPVSIFSGRISDWQADIYDAGIRNTPAAVYSITATGPLARLNRRLALAAGRPEEKDGDRIAALLGDAFATSWSQAQGTWQDQTTTWAAFEPEVDPALIDTPGVYDIIQLDPTDDGINAANHANAVAASAAGIIFETGDGRIAYADALRRPQNAADGYLDVPATVIAAGNVTTVQRDADIVNSAVVTYGAGLTATAEDTDSIERFGPNSRTLSTLLANAGDAQLRADDIVDTQAFPVVSFQDFAVLLHVDIDDALRDALIAANVNDALAIQNVPATLGRTTVAGFIEGVTFTVNPQEAVVAVSLSDAPLSIGTVSWNQLPVLAWEDVDASIQWQDARSIV